jgi:hypothetical protein
MKKVVLCILSMAILGAISAQEPKQKKKVVQPVSKTQSLTEKIKALEQKVAIDLTDPSFPKEELQKEQEQLTQLKTEQAKLNKVKTN